MATLTVSKADEKRVKGMGFLSNKGTDEFSGRVLTINGNITADQHIAIGEAAKKYGNGRVVYTTRLSVEVQGIPYENIEAFREFIEQAGLSVGGTGAKVRPVVSCKGTTCQYGLIDTYDLSEKIHRAFFVGYGEVKLPHKFKIAVGGCPNNCMKPELNDIGIVGQHVPVYDKEKCKFCKKCVVENNCPPKAAVKSTESVDINREICVQCGRCIRTCPFGAFLTEATGYKIYIGGRWGKNTAVGQPLGRFFTSEEEVMGTVEKIILFFKEQGIPGERLSQTIERLGFAQAEKEILSDEILGRKETILAEE